jgi:DNA-directed RNA polymerase subunit N (RpoN/RPB10)
MSTEASLDLRAKVLKEAMNRGPILVSRMMNTTSAYVTLEYCTSCTRRIGRFQLTVELLALLEKKTIAQILDNYSKELGISAWCCRLLLLTPLQRDIIDEIGDKINCYHCTGLENFIMTNSSYVLHSNLDGIKGSLDTYDLPNLVDPIAGIEAILNEFQ